MGFSRISFGIRQAHHVLSVDVLFPGEAEAGSPVQADGRVIARDHAQIYGFLRVLQGQPVQHVPQGGFAAAPALAAAVDQETIRPLGKSSQKNQPYMAKPTSSSPS